jgi:hypothetical protein
MSLTTCHYGKLVICIHNYCFFFYFLHRLVFQKTRGLKLALSKGSNRLGVSPLI